MHCRRSDEIVSTFFHVRLARIEHVSCKERNSALLDLQFLENVELQWSANLHLKILALYRAIKGFREELDVVKRDNNTNEAIGTKRTLRDWKVSIKCETNIGLILSKKNNMLFFTGKSLS